MAGSLVDDLRTTLGLTVDQMAGLLWVPRSGVTMAAGGHRQLPSHLLPWLVLLQEMANPSIAANDPAPAPGENITPMQSSFASRQLRLLNMELNKNELQKERVEAKLEKLEKLCNWLPRLLESTRCQADADRKQTAELLLRQSLEQRQRSWEQANLLRARNLALNSAIAHWKKLI
jgi:hypothetical protein